MELSKLPLPEFTDALAGSSGWATGRDMLKYGAVMIAVSIAVAGLIFTIL